MQVSSTVQPFLFVVWEKLNDWTNRTSSFWWTWMTELHHLNERKVPSLHHIAMLLSLPWVALQTTFLLFEKVRRKAGSTSVCECNANANEAGGNERNVNVGV